MKQGQASGSGSYSPPTGPKNMAVTANTPSDRLGNAGSQGKSSCGCGSSGGPGIGGDNCGMGTNRKG